jgi:RecG-like helicase
VPPNIENCELINCTYELKVKAKTIGWNKSPALKIPVVIGTIAIMNESLEFNDGKMS